MLEDPDVIGSMEQSQDDQVRPRSAEPQILAEPQLQSLLVKSGALDEQCHGCCNELERLVQVASEIAGISVFAHTLLSPIASLLKDSQRERFARANRLYNVIKAAIEGMRGNLQSTASSLAIIKKGITLPSAWRQNASAVRQAETRIDAAIKSMNSVLRNLSGLVTSVQLARAMNSKDGPYAGLQSQISSIKDEFSRTASSSLSLGHGATLARYSIEDDEDQCVNCRRWFQTSDLAEHAKVCETLTTSQLQPLAGSLEKTRPQLSPHNPVKTSIKSAVSSGLENPSKHPMDSMEPTPHLFDSPVIPRNPCFQAFKERISLESISFSDDETTVVSYDDMSASQATELQDQTRHPQEGKSVPVFDPMTVKRDSYELPVSNSRSWSYGGASSQPTDVSSGARKMTNIERVGFQDNTWTWSAPHGDHYRVEYRAGQPVYHLARTQGSSSQATATNTQGGGQLRSQQINDISPTSQGVANFNAAHAIIQRNNYSPTTNPGAASAAYTATLTSTQGGGQSSHSPRRIASQVGTTSAVYPAIATNTRDRTRSDNYRKTLYNEYGYQNQGSSFGGRGASSSTHTGRPPSYQTNETRGGDDDVEMSLDEANFKELSSDVKSIDPSYGRISPPEEWTFWITGRVFKALWYAEGNKFVDGPSIIKGNDNIFIEVYRFIVISSDKIEHWSKCLRITTHGGKASTKSGLNQSRHTIVYTGSQSPDKLPGETQMNKDPIRIIPLDESEKLDPLSRVNLAKPYPIEHNIRVKDLGVVSKRDLKKLLAYCREGL